MFTRTKIICTIGPATSELSTMQKMYAAGMNVVRINMSHASHDEALNVINNIKLINKNPDIKKRPIKTEIQFYSQFQLDLYRYRDNNNQVRYNSVETNDEKSLKAHDQIAPTIDLAPRTRIVTLDQTER